jgi:hypothetical protein
MAEPADRPSDLDELEPIVRAKDANRLSLLARPNVIGLDVGYRVRGGKVTQERVLKVYVLRKLPRSLLSEEQLVPPTVSVDDHEVRTDVEEQTIDQPHLFTLRSRPLRGGSSIGPTGGRVPRVTGTLGVCVTLNDGNTYILSCNHVLAGANLSPIGTDILQPSIGDGGTAAADVVADLSAFVPLDFGSTTVTLPFIGTITIPNVNRVDAALAQIRTAYNVGNREIHWIGYPRTLLRGPWSFFQRLALIGRRVCKMGRTTEFRTGTILSPFFDTFVGPYAGGQNAWFEDQLRIQGDGGRPFTSPGDSGSLVVTFDTGEPVGMVMSGAGNRSTANPIDVVLDRLTIPQL